ncbi:MAG: AsnC family transcriptional regulator, partial [Sciscionella sp.]
MVSGDPVDARLLSLVAEAGRIAVHEVAAQIGMDPREVATRLVALSASGLPLLVGVECDQQALRAALASTGPQAPQRTPGQPSGRQPVPGQPSGAQPVQGRPSGGYPVQPSGGHPAQNPPSGAYPVQGHPSGRYPAALVAVPAPHSGAVPAQVRPAMANRPPAAAPSSPVAVDPISTWGPPQTASWARGDEPTRRTPRGRARTAQAKPQQGVVGDTLRGEGQNGEQVDIRLVELVDPADYLFAAAGYRLSQGERSIVVHTELTNAATTPYRILPDLHLVLVTAEDRTIAKAPVSLSSRPPHRVGAAPGETVGGHAVFVLAEHTTVTAVRWSARPDATTNALTWRIDA